MTDRQFITGLEAADIYSKALAERTNEYSLLKQRTEQIGLALDGGEAAVSKLVDLNSGLPEEFIRRVHEVEVALRAVRAYKDRYTS